MLKVALTGNIASGKSAVAAVWRELGAHVIDADRLARQAVEPGTPAFRRIVDAWGDSVVDASGAIDRAALRELVFRDPAARARLEGIVHPAIGELRERDYLLAEAAGAEIVVADIPLLYEVGLEGDFDLVVLVDAPEPVRRERLIRDRGLDPAEADRMIAAQMPAAEKRALANTVIDNEGTLDELRAHAEGVWRGIERLARRGLPDDTP